MKLGLFTPLYNELSLEAMLDELKRYPQIEMLEIGTGGWPGAAHLDLESLQREAGRSAYRQRLAESGLGISAFSCHGNPVHPDVAIAQRDDATLRRTIELAAAMGVPTVVAFSGCPGGGPDDRTPNWITAAWPPEFAAMLEWQWTERLVPYWRSVAQLAADSGVRLALEAHPGFSVYNPETLLRLRNLAGDAIGINLDPSHLWWQGIDIPAAIRELGPAIHHVHAKDVALDFANCSRNGVLDTKSYREMSARSWSFRSVGWGHDEQEWKRIVSALRLAGYDGVLSIEHEDALASTHEGLSSAVAMLSRVLLRQPPVEAWWA
ncbi:MAG: sugar phosphate isomerase/epimerase [Acidobacteriota bacterium]|nr:sugar phosphate isomerase/epimerase [Acidobacteriota bacterium]